MSTKTSESPAKAPVREAIPFLDLVTQHLELEGELLTVFRSALRAAAFVGGAEVAAFESEFAAFCTTSDAVGLGSGTDALRFAYLAVGVESGDEVITVPNTFIATTESISQAGASIKFVDVSEGTFTMDPSALESAITPRTVGIVPVHLYGQVADMDPIMRVAERHGLWVIEDAAQAHGARYRDKQAGSIGVLGAFSFYPGKNLGACGEAGAVVGSDRAFLDRVRKLREHGQAKKYFTTWKGTTGGWTQFRLRSFASSYDIFAIGTRPVGALRFGIGRRLPTYTKSNYPSRLPIRILSTICLWSRPSDAINSRPT